ncbi:hypothetical protein SARC_04501 [Sphaeroforma arctica JP610]|uniref:U1 small nuclear ribonucleoprotein 70 kDa n=1 Tax=Sphaeroforma arctica JP610 TaxID=667725 RepID=A0A0L0G2E6_9EUKA|nr:hypothetical protein SARC_04501 [Sphaeroforma arctica JP610]KNC83245.1 hypothetical protein SARC_04501 [Sphaeroforma arctica JP610]|eukprot:XP_014157147.1 hypothetical protein SARC_04501 [Sphaeroforma arctica JP610]
MSGSLPPQLMQYFAPRLALEYKPPADKLPLDRKHVELTGIASFVSLFEDPKDTPAPTVGEDPEAKLKRLRDEKKEKNEKRIAEEIANWNPKEENKDVKTLDAFKTLFVAKLNYTTSDYTLRREFEQYGEIAKVVVTKSAIDHKPRGYAFIEFVKESDMRSAYKRADGMKIDGRRVAVDVERGRTVKGWKPRRFGGGLGGRKVVSGPPRPVAREESRAPSSYDYRGGSGGYSRDSDRGKGGGDSYRSSRGGGSSYGGGADDPNKAPIGARRGRDDDRGDRDRDSRRDSRRDDRSRDDRGRSERSDRYERSRSPRRR